jgi:mevalonate kinase
MKKITISVPSKVFIAGEYLALTGEPCLVAAIEPRFQLEATPSQNSQSSAFHADSPAGRFLQAHPELQQEFQLKFTDPFFGLGGFGASTAQFAALYELKNYRSGVLGIVQALETADIRELVGQYQELAQGSTGPKPSGADLVAQAMGNLVLFDRAHGKISSHEWPFQNLGMIIAKTPLKIPTHEHLASLQSFRSEGLRVAMDQVQDGLKEKSESAFVSGICQYDQELRALGFLHPETARILENLQHPALRAQKGCGALGADVVALFFDNSKPEVRVELASKLRGLGCQPVGDENSLSRGLSLHSAVEGSQGQEISCDY